MKKATAITFFNDSVGKRLQQSHFLTIPLESG